MMIADILSKAHRNRRRKRVGRGIGSGRGKTATRGHKGMGQHAGSSAGPLAEGGQLPLFRRIPKRGFSNARFRTTYQVVNLADLEDRFEAGTHVTAELLEDAGLIRSAGEPVKILGDGEVSKKLQVEATAFSASASQKITAAGGEAKALGTRKSLRKQAAAEAEAARKAALAEKKAAAAPPKKEKKEKKAKKGKDQAEAGKADQPKGEATSEGAE